MSTTYVRPAQALASTRQRKFIADLIRDRVTDGLDLPEDMDALSSYRAHHLINELLARPHVAGQAPAARPADPDVPAGRYAVMVPGDSKLGFFVIDKPERGAWAGRTFVNQLASDKEWPVRGARRALVLSLIAADPKAAGAHYGRTIGRCCVCNRTLTDDKSRAAGIGPDCAKAF